MIIRLLVRTIKLFVFCCILLYTLFFLNKLFDLEQNAPVINNFLAAISDIPIPGAGKLGGIVILVVGALTLSGAFDD
ncbi:MAG: hypothetical protein IJJ71_10775 [Treponema sp.]|uniref:hypothetical protein n=1 Tax=Treponema sp. TaxID=166 RepID=UPI0025CC83D1|nr:hypothetical protein [Treponema sp.]MBR0496645.1 hypothetical protein [Treponema sp.]